LVRLYSLSLVCAFLNMTVTLDLEFATRRGMPNVLCTLRPLCLRQAGT